MGGLFAECFLHSGNELVFVEAANKVVCNHTVGIDHNGNRAGLNIEEFDELLAGIPADCHLTVIPFGGNACG